MKKLISLLLALIMLISLAVPAFAEEFYDGDEIPEGNYDDITIWGASREEDDTMAKVRINGTVTVNTGFYGNGAIVIGSNGLLQFNGADNMSLEPFFNNAIIIRIEEGGVLDMTFIDDGAEDFANYISKFYCAHRDGNHVVVKRSHNFTDDSDSDCTVCGGSQYCMHGIWEAGACFYCDYKCRHEDVLEDGKCAFCGYSFDSDYVCPHDIWSGGKCFQCGFVCQHDWSKKNGDVHIPNFCSICGYHCKHEVWENEKCVNCGCECPHDEGWRGNICNICGYECHHEVWERNACAKCGLYCEHEAWENGKCVNCGWECPHRDWDDNICSKCGKYCAHDVIENGKCVQCGCPCQHKVWDDGVCTDCGYVCNHPGVGCNVCGKGIYNQSTGTAFSEGNVSIIVGMACLAVGIGSGYFLGKKKERK